MLIGQKYHIKIQTQLAPDGMYYFEVDIDGEKSGSIKVYHPSVFDNVSYYSELVGQSNNQDTIEISNLLYGGIED